MAYRERVTRIITLAQDISDSVQIEPQKVTWGHVGDLRAIDEYLTLAAGMLGIDVSEVRG